MRILVVIPLMPGGGMTYAEFLTQQVKMRETRDRFFILRFGSPNPFWYNNPLQLVRNTLRAFSMIFQISYCNECQYSKIVIFCTSEVPYLLQAVLPLLKFRFMNVKLAIKIHSRVPLFGLRHLLKMFGWYGLAAYPLLKLFLVALNGYDVVLFPSKYGADKYVRSRILAMFRNKPRFVVSGGAIDFDYISRIQSFGSFDYDAVFASSKITRQDVDLILMLWRRVVDNNPTARLLITGSFAGSLSQRLRVRSYLEGLLSKMDLSNHVQFYGSGMLPLKRDLFLSLLIPEKLFLYVSYDETWGMIIGEALSRGLIAITLDYPAIREVFGGCQAVFLCKSLEEMVKTTLLLLRLSSSYKKTLSESAQRWVKNLSYEQLIDSELRILRDLVD
ncbi:MAG: glycosyltransferase [Candidatus Caldarchaeum sp.]